MGTCWQTEPIFVGLHPHKAPNDTAPCSGHNKERELGASSKDPGDLCKRCRDGQNRWRFPASTTTGSQDKQSPNRGRSSVLH